MGFGSFFSVKGQKKRFKNVFDVLTTSFNPLSQDKVVANVKSPTIKAGLEFLGNNPFTTAGIVAGGGGLLKAGATRFTGLSIAKQSLAGGIGTVLGGAGLVSSKVRVKGIKLAGKLTPESLLKTGAGLGGKIQEGEGIGLGDVAGAGALGAVVGAAALTLLDDDGKKPKKPKDDGVLPKVPSPKEKPIAPKEGLPTKDVFGTDIPVTNVSEPLVPPPKEKQKEEVKKERPIKINIDIDNKAVSKKFINSAVITE